MFGRNVAVRPVLDKTLATSVLDPASIEQYRTLALALERHKEADHSQVVVLTSALPGEGKTVTAANLAVTLSRSYGRRVLLVDADLRHSTLRQVFATDSRSADAGGERIPDGSEWSLERWDTSLFLLNVRDEMSDDPVRSLRSANVHVLLNWARKRFEWILIDTPPAGLVPDASILSPLSDGVVFIVGAGATPLKVVRHALANLGEARVLGVVLNRAAAESMDGSLKYYKGYPYLSSSRPDRVS